MELVVGKNQLLRELQLFQGIVERKNTIPILANVLMEAKGNEVRMLATDLEVALRSRCDAAVAKGGSLTLPAKKLYEIIKALPETDIRIQEDKNGVKVAADECDSAARGAEGDGRENTIRNHRRRHAVFPERRAVRAAIRFDEPRGHRRPSPCAGDRETRRNGSSRDQGRRRSESDSAEEDAARARQASVRRRWRHPVRAWRKPSVLRGWWTHANFEDDRRPVPGLRAGDSEGQRQGH